MSDLELKPFQRRFLRGAFAPGITRAALSLPRGNGKSTLLAHVLHRALTPGDPLHRDGAEYFLLAGSIRQARRVFVPLRAFLGDDKSYRVVDSANQLRVRHMPSKAILEVISSEGRTAMGIGGNTPLVVADEPGSWEVNAGELMRSALDGSLGKPDSDMRVVYIGTLAPSLSGWWHELIADGSHGSTYVMSLQGDPDKWDQASEIRRVNPLLWPYPNSRKLLLEKRDAARRDPRLKADFLSYSLNLPTGDETQLLLTREDWDSMCARPVPPADGPAILGLDMGYNRAWSAGVAVYQSGAMTAHAVAPGLPDLVEQEKRDRVPAGTYQRLEESGLLTVVEGVAVPTADQIWTAITGALGRPVRVVADRFRMPELAPVVQGTILEPRVTRWSDASFDVRALRRGFRDGPLAVTPEHRPLVAASLAVTRVKTDDQGSTRIVKSRNNTARDDVAAALALAAGAFQRATEVAPPGPTHVVV